MTGTVILIAFIAICVIGQCINRDFPPRRKAPPTAEAETDPFLVGYQAGVAAERERRVSEELPGRTYEPPKTVPGSK